jgi:streptogramin lyase
MKRSIEFSPSIGFRLLCAAIFFMSLGASAQKVDIKNLKTIQLRMIPVTGLEWKGEKTQNTNWNKITQSPDGKIWFAGGDHWGTDEAGGFDKGDRYDRLWGFGNTVIMSYDPATDKATQQVEFDMAASIFSNAETPGHGKTHSDIISDSKGRIYFAGYLGGSYEHEYTRAHFPKSYAGGALIRFDPATKQVTNFGVPFPNGGIVALKYDEKRNRIHGLTVDRAKFFSMDLTTRELFRFESIGRMSRVIDRVREMFMDNEGFCYFANDVGGLTRFDPDKKQFIDIDIKLPGKLADFRATVVSSRNILYAITTDGLVFSYDIKQNKVQDLGHILGMPEQGHYTPNITLDEEWGRLYFIAGNHGGVIHQEALNLVTILDLNTKKYHWIGKVDGLEGCFGSVVAKDHTVYFNSFGHLFENGKWEVDKNGRKTTRPYLVKYTPPATLN